MWCCFVSNRAFAVKINGEYLGIAGSNPRGIELYPKGDFFEFQPLSDEYSKICLTYGDTEKSTSRADVIPVGDKLLFVPRFIKNYKNGFKTLKNERTYSGASVSVFFLSGCFAFIQKEGSECFKLCDEEPSSVEIYDYDQNKIIITLTERKKRVFVFDLTQTPTLALTREFNSYNTEKSFIVTRKTKSVTQIEITETFERENFTLLSTEFIRKIPLSGLPNELLPYAFLEEVALGANFEDFLSPELISQKELIPEFLGEFDFFLPKIKPDDQETAVLIKKNKAKRLSINFENRLITDLNFI